MENHARGSSSARSIVTMVAVVLCALALSACTVAGAPGSLTAGASANPDVAPQTDAPAPSGPGAAMTLASVDVDGLNATVGGLMTEVAEDGGRCRYLLTKKTDGSSFTVETTGIANVRSTSCGSVQVPITKFSKGTWLVVLHYTSTRFDLTSAPLTMEIP